MAWVLALPVNAGCVTWNHSVACSDPHLHVWGLMHLPASRAIGRGFSKYGGSVILPHSPRMAGGWVTSAKARLVEQSRLLWG